MTTTLLKNGLILTVNENSDIFPGDILIKGNTIEQIAEKIDISDAASFDASGYIVMPGFIQTHVHLCQTLFRNLADDLSLLDWLKKKIWPLEGAHTPESLRVSAQLGLAELLLGGTSTIMDMGTVHHMPVVFEEIERSGMRAFSGKTMMDDGDIPQRLRETTDRALNSSIELYQEWHNRADGRIKYAFAPRFVLTCSSDLLRKTYNFCHDKNLLFHSHASENAEEVRMVEKTFGKRNITIFKDLGIAGPDVCLAHCIWLDEYEKDILQHYDIRVLHCPSANLKLGSGIAPVPEYLQRDISVSLGADGAPCNNNLNIFNEMRLAALIQKPLHGPDAVTAEQVFRMATIGGAHALGIQDLTGSLEPGKRADIALCKINQIDSIPFENIYSKVVYSTNSSGIEHLMIDGKWVMQNRCLTYDDTERIIRQANEQINKLRL